MSNKPKIRFPGFTDDWEQRKLGDLSSSFEYGLNAAATEFDGENKYIRITDIDDDSREFNQDNVTSPDTDLSNAENYKLSEGDILFARTGASVGKTYIYKPSDGLVYYAGFLIRAKIKEDYNPEFVFQNTLTKDYEKFIKVTSMRSGQPGVNAQEYSQFEIKVPSKPEQDKIATCFRNIDNLITLHQRKCDSIKKIKKCMLQKMFPQKGEKVPEIRFSGFTDDWEQRKFGELLNETREKTTVEDEDTLLSCAIDGMFLNSELFSHFRGSSNIGYLKVKKNDLILSAQNLHLGNCNVNLRFEHGIISPAYKVYELINCNPLFMQAWVKQDKTKDFFLKAATEGASVCRKNIVWEDLYKQELPVPEIDEQEKIGYFFQNLDNLITLHQRKCDAIKELKKCLLQQMFV